MPVYKDDLVVRGNISGDSFTLPNNSIGDREFTSGDPLSAIKQEHQYVIQYTQPYAIDAVAYRGVIHVASDIGDLIGVRAGNIISATGDSTVTIDIYKNGITALGAPVVLDLNNDDSLVMEEGTIASTGVYIVDSVFEIVVTVSAGTGTLPRGVYVQTKFREMSGT